MSEKVLYIEINDWDTELQSEKCKQIFDTTNWNDLLHVFTTVDMANFCLITSTEKELCEKGYEELLEYVVNDDETRYFEFNCWLPYKPEWIGTKKGGRYFDSQDYNRAKYLFVDEYGNEILFATSFLTHPVKISYYIDALRSTGSEDEANVIEKWLEENYNSKYIEGKGWFTDFEHVVIDDKTYRMPIKLRDCINIGKGFCQLITGQKITFEDDPVKWAPFKFIDIKIWEDDDRKFNKK